MPMIHTVDGELDPAAVLAEDDRQRAEAAAERSAQRARELRATADGDGLIYRRRDNARVDSTGGATASQVFQGDDSADGHACDISELDPYTASLVEAFGDVLGTTRVELRDAWESADARLLDHINDLHTELKAVTSNYENAQARIAELEQQVTSLITTRVAGLEKRVKLLVESLPRKAARISAVEKHVEALSTAIEGEPALSDRLAYIEALMTTMFPMPKA